MTDTSDDSKDDFVRGTTLSDRELETWSAIKRADHARDYDWSKHGWGPAYIVTFMSGELLESRRLLREFLARHDENSTDPLVLRTVALLGFNLEPSQPLFPQWPKQRVETPRVEKGATDK